MLYVSDPNYNSHLNQAPSRNGCVNFNYVWDSDNQYWSPMGISQTSAILGQAKSSIHKFGSVSPVSNSVSTASPVTVWDGGTEYSFPSDTGEDLFIKSSDTGDTQEIKIAGLDANFEEKSYTATLGGTSAVSIGNWSRVFRAYNNGSTDLVGNVTIDNGATDYLKILSDNNQTLMSIYTIPANYTGYLVKFHCSAQNPASSSDINYTIHVKTREFGKVFRTRKIISISTGNSDEEELNFPTKLPPKTDIIFNVVSADGNNGSVNADFDIALL